MKPRKRSKQRVWRVWVGFVNGHPDREPWPESVDPRPTIGASLSRRALCQFYEDVRLCEIRKVPKRRKARRKP